jgi:hypothetical protein
MSLHLSDSSGALIMYYPIQRTFYYRNRGFSFIKKSVLKQWRQGKTTQNGGEINSVESTPGNQERRARFLSRMAMRISTNASRRST